MKNFKLTYTRFLPKYQTMQIILTQLSFYACLSTSLIVLNLIFDLEPHLGQVFDFSSLNYSTHPGRINLLASLLSTILFQYFILKIVENHKKVLDSVSTAYTIHLGICVVFNLKLPDLMFIVYNIGLLMICTLLGEQICYRFEDKSTPTFSGMLDSTPIGDGKSKETEMDRLV